MKIVIDPGHGGTDPGAVSNGLKEKDLTLDISLKLNEYLKKYSNIETILTRTEDRDVTLAQRANIANAANADFFVSIHINAGGGTGFESFRHINASDKTASIQTIIHKEVADFFKNKGFVDRGIKTANYAVLRETKMPAILLEFLFIDNAKDAAFLKQETNRQLIAQTVCTGIIRAIWDKAGVKTEKKEEKLMEKLFKDVPDGHWAIKDIEWAKETGIIRGDGNGDFGLGKSVTREELAVIMHRLFELLGGK